MGRILLFGGTFNPVHNGHVAILRALNDCDDFDRILLMPAAVPPHKSVSFLASSEDRLAMCRLAAIGLKKVTVSDLELRREGKSYTYDTVSELKRRSPDDNFTVVCGGDMAITLSTWYRFDELKNLCSFLAIDRIGIDNENLLESIKKLHENGTEIERLELVVDGISSSCVRTLLADGKPVDGLVPDAIIRYIRENHLYVG